MTTDIVDETPGRWQFILSNYDKIIAVKSSKISKTPKNPEGGKKLIRLDKWFQNELPKLIQSREEKYITHEELCQLMSWKLIRGKFRPRLTELVRENEPEDVVKASKKAFKKIPNLSAAIKELTVLKAVGPATASAVLAAGSPEHAPFMADEAMLALPGLQPLAYTLNHYLEYSKKVDLLTRRLNKDSNIKDELWTCHKVELVLWAYYIAKQLEPSLIEDTFSAQKRSLKDGNGSVRKKKK